MQNMDKRKKDLTYSVFDSKIINVAGNSDGKCA